MNYNWLKYEDIVKYPYPNLMAEIKESGYSICTMSQYMGYGMCKEKDKRIWDKLTGMTPILASEGFALGRLFEAKMEYLFSHDLATTDGVPNAKIKWEEEYKRLGQNNAAPLFSMIITELPVKCLNEMEHALAAKADDMAIATAIADLQSERARRKREKNGKSGD